MAAVDRIVGLILMPACPFARAWPLSPHGIIEEIATCRSHEACCDFPCVRLQDEAAECPDTLRHAEIGHEIAARILLLLNRMQGTKRSQILLNPVAHELNPRGRKGPTHQDEPVSLEIGDMLGCDRRPLAHCCCSHCSHRKTEILPRSTPWRETRLPVCERAAAHAGAEIPVPISFSSSYHPNPNGQASAGDHVRTLRFEGAFLRTGAPLQRREQSQPRAALQHPAD